MTVAPDDITYDQFLDTWVGTRHLEHATLRPNLFDPLAQARLLADVAGATEVPRNVKVTGTYNEMTDEEEALRHLEFFRSHQSSWAEEFRERLVEDGVRSDRVDTFINAMARHWVDGSGRRQGAREMRALKTSIGLHDRKFHPDHAGQFVLNGFDESIEPLFDPEEMWTIFEVNTRMLENHMAAYLREVFGDRAGSINWLFVRRGVCMPHEPKPLLEELHYLSSYSLASGPVELFAQTQGKTSCGDRPCIFSAPLPAVQHRVVAFAPFIESMQLEQMEFVVAPPVRPTPIAYHGEYGDPPARVGEYEFE
jgi:hypothetical protein